LTIRNIDREEVKYRYATNVLCLKNTSL